jgi:thymidylate synthase (FAD)
MTPADSWRRQAQDNKQGSSGLFALAEGEQFSAAEQELHRLSKEVYQQRLDAGVAREQARKDLPLSTYTEAFWQIDLHNLLHFLALRMDSHAQLEIRRYAETIGEKIVKQWVPATWEAFQDYRFGQMTLSRQEQELLTLVVNGQAAMAVAWCTRTGWVKQKQERQILSREAKEFAVKLESFGLTPPW